MREIEEEKTYNIIYNMIRREVEKKKIDGGGKKREREKNVEVGTRIKYAKSGRQEIVEDENVGGILDREEERYRKRKKFEPKKEEDESAKGDSTKKRREGGGTKKILKV